MVRARKATMQETLRLDAIAMHLKVKSRYPDPTFTADVSAACMTRIAPIVDTLLPCTGEQISDALAKYHCVTFEEVHGPHDVDKLETRYLKGKRELGFAQLRDELKEPGVDALLFERMNADETAPDRWVAVLNLQDSEAKAYWNRIHELTHRIVEPPQGILPFRRHQFEASNPVEALIDSVAAEIAFYRPAFQPVVLRFAKRNRLDFNTVQAIQATYAPTASLLATIKAIAKFWPRPAAALTAEYRGRVNAPHTDEALRVTLQGANDAASNVGLRFFPNMRVPAGSPIDTAFQLGGTRDGTGNLGHWSTSKGERLAPLDTFTSARRIGSRVYALVSA